MTPILHARGIGLPIRLSPTDLDLAPGTLTALIGPNGSGKTSLLRRMAGIEQGLGSITLDGHSLDKATPAIRRGLLAFLPASRELAWPIAARDTIALGLTRRDDGRVEELLTLLALQPLADRHMDRLSTGERARVLLARALSPRPRLLLLDEPLSNLDPAWVLRILEVLRAAVTDGAAALVSLHDLALLERFDRAILMGDGAVRADSDPAAMLAGQDIPRWFGVRRPTEAPGWQLV